MGLLSLRIRPRFCSCSGSTASNPRQRAPSAASRADSSTWPSGSRRLVGYGNTSFARIAKAAELSSTGIISYNFAGKDDLMREIVGEVLRVAGL